MNIPLSRRRFLKKTPPVIGGLALASTLPTHGQLSTDTRTRVGVIGCGWWGMVVLKAALEAGPVRCVALADVDTAHLDSFAEETQSLQGGSPPAKFTNWKELLDKVELDFVIIATPPQWHALQFIEACGKGIDIYIEKPLSYDVREGQAMVDATRKAGNVVQVGFQRRQSPSVKEARDYIRSGQAGEIVQVDAQIHYQAKLRSTLPEPPPATLDWDAWCGPAPKLTYTPNIGHIAWRLEKEYGNGHMVDWGIHWIDSIRYTLGLTIPRAIQAAGGIYHLKGKITTPDTLSAHFDFHTVPVHWRHRLWGATEVDPDHRNCAIYYGSKATVLVTDRKWVVLPVDKDVSPTEYEPKTETNNGVAHMADFLKARETRSRPSCSIEEGYFSSATVQLGMIAYDVKERILWDAEDATISGNRDARRLLKRDYRGWMRHPG